MGSHAQLEQHATNATATSNHEPARAGGRSPAARAPSSHQVDKLTGARGIGVKSTVAFGDHLVGSTSFVDVPIANLDPHAAAWVRVTIEDGRDFVVAAFPERVQPSRDGFDPASVVRLAFQPAREGAFEGTATIEMGWPNTDRATETRTVSIVGEAHADGSPTWDERRATAAEQHAKEVSAAADQERNRAVVSAHDRRLFDRTRHPQLTDGSTAEYHARLDQQRRDVPAPAE